ncbi:HVO_2523 family zinc finger protein [Halobellus inordinatus]|uniref:HVO_2523 family zinc finger protein n=1 Tax=Halobellus inordinatus TaxID=1126236 RepID=UPI00210A362F
MSDANEPTSASGQSDASVEDAPADGVETPPGRPCPICERPMAHRHCKYVCPEHGVVYDCSDTFW